jgi:signal transduction histidine kinase
MVDDEQPELFLDGLLRLDGLTGTLLPQLMSQARSKFTGNGRITRPNGDAVPILVQTSTMTGRAPGEKWLVVVAEDLRTAKKLEAERQRAENLVGLVEMSATLAHEIRNPLMGLSAQAELLAEQLSGDDKRARYLDVITTEVDRINETINRLLNFVRPYEPQLSGVVLPDLVQDCLELVVLKAATLDVTMKLEAKTDGKVDHALPLQLDSAQIKQVLLNLLLNALDAAPAGSEVIVCWEQSPRLELSDHRRGTTQTVPGIVLQVSDAGEGVPEGDRERIFRPFYTTKSSGTGLGLSISWKIVTAHGGEIRVERRDERTVFSVLLPQNPNIRGRELAQESS